MGDLAHGRARRFAHHRDQVIVLADPVHVEAPLLHESGGRRRGDERLDEDADRDEPAGAGPPASGSMNTLTETSPSE